MQRLTRFKFSRQNYLGIMFRKSFWTSIKENHGLHEGDDIAEHIIPTIVNEEK
jgi:hypothetical protein